jgi:hypothetical protein
MKNNAIIVAFLPGSAFSRLSSTVRQAHVGYIHIMKSKFYIFLLLLSFLSTVVQAQTNFTSTGSLTTARYNHTATLLPNGLLLVAGGYNYSYIASSELYNPATGTWATTGSLNTARQNHTATLLPNGLVLVAGGNDEGGELASCELYNPATGTWTTTGSLNNAREGHTATLLPNGLVLVVAGVYLYNGSGFPLIICELYNPATGIWTTIASLSTARDGHTATLLPNGLVLVAGGDDYNSVLASCDLYYSGFEGFIPPAIQTLAVGSAVTARTVNGLFTLNFTNVIGMPFNVLTTTNAALPVASWSVLGVPTEFSPSHFQFTDSQLPTARQRFYRISSP